MSCFVAGTHSAKLDFLIYDAGSTEHVKVRICFAHTSLKLMIVGSGRLNVDNWEGVGVKLGIYILELKLDICLFYDL